MALPLEIGIFVLLCPLRITGGVDRPLPAPKTLAADVAVAKEWLQQYDLTSQVFMFNSVNAEWIYNTNITKFNTDARVAASLEEAEFRKEAAKNATMFDWKNFQDEMIRRQFMKISDVGTAALTNKTKLARMEQIQTDMEGIFSKAKVCLSNGKCLEADPGLYGILANSRNYELLLEVWQGWRDSTGKLMRQMYEEFVQLNNEAIQADGYNDTGEYWRSNYESTSFEQDVAQLWEQLRPLYEQLHAYVRRGLMKVYGKDKFPDEGHIPAHLLGNMWSQEWNNIYSLLEPFPGKESVDVTDALKEQNYTPLKMFKTAEGFYTSIGLMAMNEGFWNNSMITRPTDGRDVVCYASAWDFYNAKDFRIKMCTDVTMEDLVTIHHEMGHIQYFMHYMTQPTVFRDGANSGFHEAIGDTMALSVSTPKHLHKINLLRNGETDDEAEINYLFKMALEKIAFLPFGYLMDQWRWSVFKGETKPQNYTQKWWDLRCKYQGISAPVERTESDFDPGSKYHIAANVPYIRYFVSFVIQFQFHKALCNEAKQTGPLNRCDIYQSKEAGKLLGDMLKLGSSKPWPEAMQNVTGQQMMNASALMEYFAPLTAWLEKQNKGDNVTWTDHCPPPPPAKNTNTTLAKQWLDSYNIEAQKVYFEREIAAWNYESNLTSHNQKLSVAGSLKKDLFKVESARNTSMFDWKDFTDEDLKRKFRKISDVGTSDLPDQHKLEKLNQLVADMQGVYSRGEVCIEGQECLHLEPGLTETFTSNRSYYHLLRAWQAWRDATGRKIRPMFAEFVKLSNEAIAQTGYSDTGEYWRSSYEDDNFQKELEGLYDQLKPLYQNLHAYVRSKLREHYGKEKFPTSGHIPAHILGNMWAQQWNNILDLTLPYPEKQSVDVTPEMIAQKYTPLRMFETAEEFYTSLGLLKMPSEFWNESIIERPKDGRQLTCHASAWDFYNSKNFRIKMCTRINMEDLITIHHEMGHIQYYLQYKDKPLVYRDGANPGFHEAVGDTLALSVGTPLHLKKIGLLKTVINDKESDINHLMKVALEKIAFLPFGYLIDLYRWDVFSGKARQSEYNQRWWDLRCKYQGLSSPVMRTEMDFDPGAKFHIPANVPYIRYFVSFVIQFQFHQALCNAANHTGPLSKCDIYRSHEAGTLLGDMLKMGSSQPWPEAMEKITGQRNMNASALMEYFQPLTEWLIEQNKKSGEVIGWQEQCPPPSPSDEADARHWLKYVYEPEAEKMLHESAVATFTYDTNLTDYNQEVSVNVSLKVTEWAQEAAHKGSLYNWTFFHDSDIKRQMKIVTDLGTAALKDKAKLKRLAEVTSEMEAIYSKAQVCMKGTCQELEPGLTRLMASSRDYQALLDAWKGWRDATGVKLKPMYEEFVGLSNEGVRAAGYNDTGAEWRSWYETSSFEEDLEHLYEQLRPLYENLHAYVRQKLKGVYGNDVFPENGHIPAHLFGNMWAQQWNNIYDIVQPYKDQPILDVTPQLKEQKFTALKMFRTAEEFYTSIGLLEMPDTFWNLSMITKPTDGRKVVCHASAWDLGNRKDYRIKMCTDINMEDLVTIHHEMGHIQYYLQYKNQPISYRSGANPGFHEAVGDTLALSVSTPAHLYKIGLLKTVNTTYESDINYLLKIALEKIAFLPFGYLIDQWRWSVFSGETPPDKYNDKWWDLRCKYQGISYPVTRTKDDFDAGAKYHVPANTPYIRYFVSFVIQFQFHKALCEAAHHNGPLHTCDIYQSREAGDRLGNMLKMGASRPWPDAMEKITRQRKMDAEPLMNYFQPLTDWLKEQNKNENIGWAENCPPVPDVHKTKTPMPPCPTGKTNVNSGHIFRTSFVVIILVILASMIVH